MYRRVEPGAGVGSASPGQPENHEPEPAGQVSAVSRWTMLALLSAGQLLGMSLWFTASAVAPQLAAAWALDTQQVGWLTGAVQLGFVAGTAVAAVLNLADILPARRLFAGSALLAAVANGSVLLAPGFETALVFRFFTGFFLAGVYPPAMKMAATWFRTGRSLAIGMLIGALTVGKAMPFLVNTAEPGSVGGVILASSAGAVAAALLVALGYRDGPFAFPRHPFSWGLVRTVVRHRPTRLAIAGYLGHMWELYAVWSCISLFLLHYFGGSGVSGEAAATRAGLATFAVIGVGGIGCVLAGRWGDRFGRENVAAAAMAVSGACALTMGWLGGAPAWLVLGVGLLWGFAVVADSALFSALVADVAPPHAVGTALSLQTSTGFLLTVGSIWLTIELAERLGWGPAFALLAVGPALGIRAILRLKRLRAASPVRRQST